MALYFLFVGFRMRYSQYKVAQVLDTYGQKLKEVQSSFFLHLASMHWVPAQTPDMDRPGYLTKGFCAAQDLYMDLQELSELLDCHVPYVAIALPASDLHHSLGGILLTTSVYRYRFIQIL